MDTILVYHDLVMEIVHSIEINAILYVLAKSAALVQSQEETL